MPRHFIPASAIVGAVLCSLGLTGCPLTDRYYVDEDKTQAGGNSGAEGGQTNSGNSVATSAGANSNSTGGTTTGGASSTCDVSTCTGTCCGTVCANLDNDAAHCGACDTACPTSRSCRTGKCYGWTSMAAPPVSISAREKFAYGAMDGKLFIFGGLDASGKALADGAVYDPATDSWSTLASDTNAPSARQMGSAIWTGLRMFVIGGTDATSTRALADGGRYDPSTKSWLTLPALPTGRVAPYLANLSTQQYVMAWGGLSSTGAPLSGGERYVYSGTSWTALPTASGGPGSTYTPPPRLTDLTWAPGTDGIYLFGGLTDGTNKTVVSAGYSYYAQSYQWMALYGTGPSAREGAFGVWDGTTFFVWGGKDMSSVLGDGSRYTYTGWSAMSSASAPRARYAPHRRSGHAFALGTGDIIVIGGVDGLENALTDGGRYVSSTNTWTPIDSWPSGEAHEYGAAVLLNGEVFVWGGRNGAALSSVGERYLP